MPRCTATTVSGRRCKLSALVDETTCNVHFYADMPALVPLDQPFDDYSDMPALIPIDDEDYSDMPALIPIDYPIGPKHCGHSCQLLTRDCCGCYDKRIDQRAYMRYVDGVGLLPVGKREDGYCADCKKTFVTTSWITERATRLLKTPLGDTHEYNNALGATARALSVDLRNTVTELQLLSHDLYRFSLHASLASATATYATSLSGPTLFTEDITATLTTTHCA